MNTTCFAFPSTSPGHAAWVPDPSCRGTFGIALLCLSTTLICIWSSVHRDIPLERLSAARSLLRSAPLVFVALFAPELLFYFALNQFLCAKNLVKLGSRSKGFGVPSDEERGGDGDERISSGLEGNLLRYLDNNDMGRRRAEDGNCGDDIGLRRVVSEVPTGKVLVRRPRRHQFTLKHGFYATMGGFAFTVLDEDGNITSPNILPAGQTRAKFTHRGIEVRMEHEPDLIPDLSLESITDRSKSNSLGKALLIVQVASFCLNCVSRLAERLPLSLLEVSTLSHGLFTILSYAMWWFKPFSIDEPTWIPMTDDRTREAFALLQVLSDPSKEVRESFCDLMDSPRRVQESNISVRVGLALNASRRYELLLVNLWRGPGWYLTFDSVPKFTDLFVATGFLTLGSGVRSRAVDYTVIACIPLIYGSLHLLGLHIQFPTMIEGSMWRIASVVIMSSGVVNAMFDSIGWSVAQFQNESLLKTISKLACYRVIPFIYMLGSGYLLVESIRQLWYLPHEAFVIASWSYYIPHWL